MIASSGVCLAHAHAVGRSTCWEALSSALIESPQDARPWRRRDARRCRVCTSSRSVSAALNCRFATSRWPVCWCSFLRRGIPRWPVETVLASGLQGFVGGRRRGRLSRSLDLSLSSGLRLGGNPLRKVRRVVCDEPEQCGPAGVLPGQAEEVQSGYVGDPAPMQDMAIGGDFGDGDPGVVGPVAGGPDHDGNVEGAVVGETRGVSLGVDQAGPESDAGLLEPAVVGADDELSTCLQAAAKSGCGIYAHEAESG